MDDGPFNLLEEKEYEQASLQHGLPDKTAQPNNSNVSVPRNARYFQAELQELNANRKLFEPEVVMDVPQLLLDDNHLLVKEGDGSFLDLGGGAAQPGLIRHGYRAEHGA